MTEFSNPSPDHEQPLRAPVFFKMLGHLAIHSYNHLPLVRSGEAPLFAIMEQELVNFPQPLHPEIPTAKEHILEMLANHTVVKPERLSFPDKLTRSARMIQFTDRLLSSEHSFFDYNDMKILKDHFVTLAEQQAHPLGFDQQLDIALKLAGGDITRALTKLWLTSRQYARWLDGVSIYNLPELTPEETLTEMKEWRKTILACKNADKNNFQDTAGDNYYAWTHTRARVMYGNSTSVPDRIGKFIFKHGTTINTHRFIEQSIPSDHRRAAAYGNSIGDAILDVIKTE